MASRSGRRSAAPTCSLSSKPATRRARPSSASRQGQPAFEAPPVQPDTVADVCAGWLKRHVEAKGLRTGDELERQLERYVLPRWRDRPFTAIRRSDVAALLDAVEDKHGPWVADQVLAVLGSVSSWYATRHDDYVPPFVKGMRRVPAQARKRSRTLSDAELRAGLASGRSG